MAVLPSPLLSMLTYTPTSEVFRSRGVVFGQDNLARSSRNTSRPTERTPLTATEVIRTAIGEWCSLRAVPKSKLCYSRSCFQNKSRFMRVTPPLVQPQKILRRRRITPRRRIFGSLLNIPGVMTALTTHSNILQLSPEDFFDTRWTHLNALASLDSLPSTSYPALSVRFLSECLSLSMCFLGGLPLSVRLLGVGCLSMWLLSM